MLHPYCNNAPLLEELVTDLAARLGLLVALHRDAHYVRASIGAPLYLRAYFCDKQAGQEACDTSPRQIRSEAFCCMPQLAHAHIPLNADLNMRLQKQVSGLSTADCAQTRRA